MRILYGVTGEGLGHAMRSRVVMEVLRAQGHEVLVAASGRAAECLAARGHHVVAIEGFELRYRDGALLRAQTLGTTLRRAPRAIHHNLRAFAREVDPFAPELAVTDFDSFAHAYGVRRGIPVVSLDHHHVMTRCAHDASLRAHLAGRGSLTRGVVRAKLPGCAFYIASSFYQPAVLPRFVRDTRVIGPILRPDVLARTPTRGEHVLVYQTSKDQRDLDDVLASAPGAPFVVYGAGRKAARANVEHRAFEEARFLDDLASARAVIANGGHTVLAEALHLEKPLLAVPIRHQGEQELNAAYLAAMGRGRVARRLTPAALTDFFAWVDAGGGEVANDAPRPAPGNDSLGPCLIEAFARATGTR